MSTLAEIYEKGNNKVTVLREKYLADYAETRAKAKQALKDRDEDKADELYTKLTEITSEYTEACNKVWNAVTEEVKQSMK